MNGGAEEGGYGITDADVVLVVIWLDLAEKPTTQSRLTPQHTA